jgi:hypothetical protein
MSSFVTFDYNMVVVGDLIAERASKVLENVGWKLPVTIEWGFRYQESFISSIRLLEVYLAISSRQFYPLQGHPLGWQVNFSLQLWYFRTRTRVGRVSGEILGNSGAWEPMVDGMQYQSTGWALERCTLKQICSYGSVLMTFSIFVSRLSSCCFGPELWLSKNER